MNYKTALFLAFRAYFRNKSNKKEKNSKPLFGAIIGISLSLVPLIAVIHLSTSMIDGIVGRSVETSTYHLQVLTYDDIGIDTLTNLESQIEQQDGVLYAFVESQGAGIALSETGKTGVLVRGMDPTIWDVDKKFQNFIEFSSGSFDLEDDRSILLGEEIARKLNAEVGDEIKILTGKRFSNGKFIPRFTKLNVKGIFSSGYQEMDGMWVMVNISRALTMISEDKYNFIGVKVENHHDNLNNIRYKIADLDNERDWRVISWERNNNSLKLSLDTTRMLLTVIMSVIVLVALINVSSSLVGLVIEQQQDIGFLKCVGASPPGITRVYRLIGLFAGIIGSIIGTVLGVTISLSMNSIIQGIEWFLNLFKLLFHSMFGQGDFQRMQILDPSFYLNDFNVEIDFIAITVVCLSTIFLSWLASAIPAKRTSRIRPLQILRKI